MRSAILSIPLFLLSFNASAASVNYSPYADLTINTHWDSQYQDMEPMDLLAISQANGIKQFHLAFITDAGSCDPAWAGQASFATSHKWGVHLTDALRANGIATTVAFGGASGADLSKACSDTQLIQAFTNIIQTYQPQGLDFDIENGSADVAKLMRSLQTLQAKYPAIKLSFTLPVMPEGLTSQGIEVVKAAKANGLTYHVNIMAMDYGPGYTNDMGQYAIQAATSLNTFLKSLYPDSSADALWQMIEVTPMIGLNDVTVERFTLSNVDTLRNFARQNNLGGLAIWSIARDNPCADKWVSAVCSSQNLQATPYEFSRRFI